MITCVIRYDLDRAKVDAFDKYARRERFIRWEERLFLRLASAPHGPVSPLDAEAINRGAVEHLAGP